MNKKQLTILAAAGAMLIPAACNPVTDTTPKGVERTPTPAGIPTHNDSLQLYNGLQNALSLTEMQPLDSAFEKLVFFINSTKDLLSSCDSFGVEWSGNLSLVQTASGFTVFKQDSLDPGNCVEIMQISIIDPRLFENVEGIEALTLLITLRELMHGPAATYVQYLESQGELAFQNDEERAVLVDGLAVLSLSYNQRSHLFSDSTMSFFLIDPELQIIFVPGVTEIDDPVVKAVNKLRASGVLGSLKDGRPASINPLGSEG